MTGSKNLSVLPDIQVHGSDLAVVLDAYHLKTPNACDVQVINDQGHEFILNSRVQTLKGKMCLLFAITELEIPTLRQVTLLLDGQPIHVTDAFIKYKLDGSKLTDNAYMTQMVFNAGTRGLSGDDLFVISYAYFHTLPLENPNFGGFITILTYRITDELASRGLLLEELYQTYRKYREVVVHHDALAFRWFVSCSSALTTALLSTGRIRKAEEVADKALNLIVHPSFNPMVHQNFALLLFQSGLIKAFQERYSEATPVFIGAINAGRYGITDLLHPQNSWMLGQLSDCHKLLHISEAAYIAAVACSRNKLPPASRFAQLGHTPKVQINFPQIFDRFKCFKGTVPHFFLQTEQKMQAYLGG